MLRRVCTFLALALAAGHCAAETLIAGPDGQPRSFAAALEAAKDGDLIELLPGRYAGQVAVIRQKKLTLRGVGGRPVFDADGKHAEGKAIWVVRDGDITVENVEFRGARVPDANGAGIRFEKGRLTLRRCRFADNEISLATGNDEAAELFVEDSEFGQAPQRVGGLAHLLYAGRIGRLEVRGSRFHQGFEGHLIKSRAKVSRIAYNLIFDGEGGGASYEIDLPNGGDAVVIGNIIGQSRATQNPVMVSYGAEGRPWPVNRLLLSHNTLVSDHPLTWFLRTWLDKLGPESRVRAVNNVTVGTGLFALAASGEFDGNWPALQRMLADPSMMAFELPPDGFLRGRADDPRALAGDEAVPTAEFVFPVGTRALAPPAQWSPGALQR